MYIARRWGAFLAQRRPPRAAAHAIRSRRRLKPSAGFIQGRFTLIDLNLGGFEASEKRPVDSRFRGNDGYGLRGNAVPSSHSRESGPGGRGRVAHPRLPRIRACPTRAPGSSDNGRCSTVHTVHDPRRREGIGVAESARTVPRSYSVADDAGSAMCATVAPFHVAFGAAPGSCR